MKQLGRLLRLSLAPSAAADVAAGIVLGGGCWPVGFAPFLLIAASLCVYHGGMVLNDWADREHDGETRPDRPIPSGRVPAGAAGLLGFALLLAGPWIAVGAGRGPAFVLGGVAALAAAYDLFGRGPVLGPMLLGLCRFGNVTAGIVFGRLVAAEMWPDAFPGSTLIPAPPELGVAVLYGLYVFLVSVLGRLEDGEDPRMTGRRPGFLVAAIAGLLLSLPIVPIPFVPLEAFPEEPTFLYENRITLASLVAAAGAFGLLRAAFRRAPWTRPRLEQTMGMALRRLLIFTSASALLSGTQQGLIVAVAILVGYPVSFALRRVFPPS